MNFRTMNTMFIVIPSTTVALLFLIKVANCQDGNVIPGFAEIQKERDPADGGGGGGLVENAVNPDDLIDTKMLSGCDHLHQTGGSGGRSGFSESWNMPHVHDEDIYTGGGGGYGYVPQGGEGIHHTLEVKQDPPRIKDELKK